MANDWLDTTLGDVLELKRGFDLPNRDRRPGGVPIVSSSGVSGSHVEAKVAGPGVVTGRYGTIGQVFYIPSDFWPLNTTLYVNDFRGNDPRFVSYFLKTIDYLAYSDKAAVPGVNRNHLHQARVRIPPLSQQIRIAEILGALDDKIELNRRMNETLEAMARRLFKSWFVDFDPVHAKAALRRGNTKLSNAELSHRALPKMAPEVAELFPDSFQDSPLGRIPKGWISGKIGDLVSIDRSSVTPSESPDESFDHYSIPAFDEGRTPTCETGHQIKSNKFIVTKDCVLLTKLNPRIRRVWFPFPSDTRRSLCSTEFLVLRSQPGIQREFLYSLVSSQPFFEVYETMVTGTSGSHQRIRPEHLLNMNCVLPPERIREAFATMARCHLAQGDRVRRDSNTLTTIRDALLPRLLKGELRCCRFDGQSNSLFDLVVEGDARAGFAE